MNKISYWAYPSIISRKSTSSRDEATALSIIKRVCEDTGILKCLLEGRTRKREVVEARQIAMFFIKKKTHMSLKGIGLLFGGRDHSTVIHANQTVTDLIEYDKKFQQKVEMIEYNLYFQK